MLISIYRKENDMDIEQLSVNLPRTDKKQFQVKCTLSNTDMTTIIKKFISLYLSDNEVLMPLLTD